MWSKLSSVLKSKTISEEPEPSLSQSNSQGDVMSRVYEQHPNLSVFHKDTNEQHAPTPSPPGSPSRKRGVLKRLSKLPLKDDASDTSSIRATSPVVGPPTKKVGSLRAKFGTTSQLSLSRMSSDINQQEIARRSSSDMLRTSIDTTDIANRSSVSPKSGFRRPSLDMLRFNQDPPSPQDSVRSPPSAQSSEEGHGRTPITPAEGRFGSVRSILRDPRTPGTGQNVRFFSRDAYKVISPEQSMGSEGRPIIQDGQASSPLAEHISNSEGNTSPITRSAGKAKASRPSVSEVFSPLSESSSLPSAHEQAKFISSTGQLPPIPPPDFSDLFRVSQVLDLPTQPPGLGFDVQEPPLDGTADMSLTDQEDRSVSAPLSSTPFKGKGREDLPEVEEEDESEPIPRPPSPQIDEDIFHRNERSRSPLLPSPIHDRSQSFSFGQSVFSSIIKNTPTPDVSLDDSRIYSAADLKPSLLDGGMSPPRASSPLFSRNRTVSDTVFQSMIRSPSRHPEADINDESSSELVVYTAGSPEPPDPFRANATTYYTPQTMIPITPPPGMPKHTRKTSKEENMIFSLQTQLTLQTELCNQYETDLRARDELVELLQKKAGEYEKEDAKRKATLRTWKKKVQELERMCRYLEEEVEGSRHDSMERSIMDEASGEALRMLHRQIAVLEKDKGEWSKKEEALRDEVATLEGLVKERSEDVMNLKESLWMREESERELTEGLKAANEQIEMMGNISMVLDEEEMRKLANGKEVKNEERPAVASGWEEERADLISQIEALETDKANLQEDLESTNMTLAAREEEYEVLKAELNAQWEHTEKSSEKMEALENQNAELEKEAEALRLSIEELEQRLAVVNADFDESENRKTELESEVHDLWNYKEELEHGREELERQLEQERSNVSRTAREQEDRILGLTQELQFSNDNVSRLEDKLRQRDEEVDGASDRVKQSQAEAEEIREQMSHLRREHARVVDQQNRALEDVSARESEARSQMEALIRQQAEVEVDKINALKEEVERLRRQIHDLHQESADKELKLVQLNKQHQDDREDMAGLNMALDAKQQELELVKRKMGVRGAVAATPSRTTRRDSNVFDTPKTQSAQAERPSSVLSNTSSTTSKSRKLSISEATSSAVRVSALGKSGRVNGATSTVASMARRIEGSMGPPPVKPRPSLSTPTPAARVPSHGRSSSVKPTPATPTTVGPHRRVLSAEQTPSQIKAKISRPSLTPSEQDGKENLDLASKRRVLAPAI